MRLTEPQKRALRHLAKFPEQWRKDTPVRQRCLNVLNEKGLVRVAFEPEEGFIEMITPAGLDEISPELFNEDRVMRQITLTLEGEQPLGLNRLLAREHWTIRDEEVDRVKLAVRAALDPNWPMLEMPVTITVTVYFKNKGVQLDASNIPAKFYEDGLIDWLIVDDSPEYVKSMTTVSLIDRQNPRVEIEIREVEDD